jgi:hypothetical protein
MAIFGAEILRVLFNIEKLLKVNVMYKIRRFDLITSDERTEYAAMGKEKNGEFVAYEDFVDFVEDFQYDLRELQTKYDKLVNKLGDLYRET